MASDHVEGREQAGDVFLRLFISPPVSGVAVDIVEAIGSSFLDANGGHQIRPGSAQSPQLQSAVCKSPPGLRKRGSVPPSTY